MGTDRCLLLALVIACSVGSAPGQAVGDELPSMLLHAWRDVETVGVEDVGRGDLDRTLDDCRMGRIHDQKRCGKAEYFSAVLQDVQRSQEALNASATIGGEVAPAAQQQEVTAIPSAIGFQDFFKEYAMKLRPVKLLSEEEGAGPLGDVGREEVEACLSSLGAAAGTPVSVSKCPSLASKLRVPRFVANDYTQRLRLFGDTAVAEIADRYPELLTPGPAASPLPPQEACPSSMHLLLAVQSGSMEIKAVGPDQSHLLGPVPGNGAFPHSFTYTADAWGTADVRVRVSAPEPAAATDDEWVEKEEGEEGGEEEKPPTTSHMQMSASPTTSAHVNWTVTTLRVGDMLFLPRDHVAAWRFRGGNAEGSALAFCYVDASNLNAAKAALELEGYLSKRSERVLQALDSPELELAMDRTPQDMPYAQFVQWPRVMKVDSQSESETEGVEAANATQKGPAGRRRKGGFKEWQMANRWNFMVLGLTISAPSVPVVRAAGRHNVTLEWTSAFTRKKDDVGQLGYHISWEAHRSLTHAGDARQLNGNVTVLESEVEKSVAVHDPRTAQGHHVSLYRTTVRGLEANTIYKVRVRTFLSEATGPWSGPSKAFTTSPYSLPWVPAGLSVAPDTITPTSLALDLKAPHDDGGLPLRHVIVWKKHLDEGFHEEWMIAGNFSAPSSSQRLELRNLLPDASYTFKAAAVNGIGIGPQTHPTEPVRTKPRQVDERLLHIAGHGHRDAHEPNLHGEAGPLVQLDDTAETVTFAGPEGKGEVVAEVWAAHWSPRHFRVTAEAVWSDPPQASTRRLSNAGVVRQRLAVVERGGVPLVEKAAAVQAAGGLGVIVVDDGRCTSGFDQFCCPGADKNHGEGLAASDFAMPWKKIRIPVVLMLRKDADALIEKMYGYVNRGGVGEEPAAAAHDEL